ncbi:hypothetical protein Dsin_008982 [Dipteronia sinensis]|uniref:Uncharacterized protein n=1 Tax=Dipteronia sinensis TaxID=43782 RepID=A0AAE0AQ29_9ROSI|nr:hypothetical protein Dsin_008982 [Dipteronia sinensis]
MTPIYLDELEEKRDMARVRNVAYQQRVARYYNSHVRERKLQLGDLVLRRVSPNTKDKAVRSLGGQVGRILSGGQASWARSISPCPTTRRRVAQTMQRSVFEDILPLRDFSFLLKLE